MADTVPGAVRDIIVAAGVVNQRVWQDRAPQGATFPYVTILDGIATQKWLEGDQRTLMLSRLLQVSLWEKEEEENTLVRRALYVALDGAKAVINGKTVTRISIQEAPRIFEADTHIVHRPFTLSIRHDPSAF